MNNKKLFLILALIFQGALKAPQALETVANGPSDPRNPIDASSDQLESGSDYYSDYSEDFCDKRSRDVAIPNDLLFWLNDFLRQTDPKEVKGSDIIYIIESYFETPEKLLTTPDGDTFRYKHNLKHFKIILSWLKSKLKSFSIDSYELTNFITGFGSLEILWELYDSYYDDAFDGNYDEDTRDFKIDSREEKKTFFKEILEFNSNILQVLFENKLKELSFNKVDKVYQGLKELQNFLAYFIQKKSDLFSNISEFQRALDLEDLFNTKIKEFLEKGMKALKENFYSAETFSKQKDFFYQLCSFYIFLIEQKDFNEIYFDLREIIKELSIFVIENEKALDPEKLYLEFKSDFDPSGLYNREAFGRVWRFFFRGNCSKINQIKKRDRKDPELEPFYRDVKKESEFFSENYPFIFGGTDFKSFNIEEIVNNFYWNNRAVEILKDFDSGFLSLCIQAFLSTDQYNFLRVDFSSKFLGDRYAPSVKYLKKLVRTFCRKVYKESNFTLHFYNINDKNKEHFDKFFNKPSVFYALKYLAWVEDGALFPPGDAEKELQNVLTYLRKLPLERILS